MDGGSWHCLGGSDQDHPQEKEMQKAKWLSEEALQIAEKRREAKGKGEKERYTHLNAEFQRTERRDQCKEVSSSVINGKKSVQFSRSVMSDSLRPHGLHHARLPCPSPTPGSYSNSCPSSRWCHPTISSSVVPFFSCLQSFPASGSFPMSHLFTSHGQSIGVSASASVLPMNIQDWFLLRLTGLISLQSKRLSRVSNTTVQKHQFFRAQLSL